jgi:hypothetical protein
MLVISASFSIAQAAHAGAWLQQEGQGLFIGQATYFTSDHYLDASKDELQPYVEYGLLSNLTVGGTAFAQRDSQSDESHDGIADPEIFVRTSIWKDDKQVVSLQPLIKFTSIYGSEDAPRGGSKSTDAELSLLYGRNVRLISDQDYIDLRGGYRERSGSLNDEWLTDAAVGLQLNEHWQLIPAISTVTSTGIKHNVAFSENGDLDYDLLKAQLTAAYHFDDKRAVQLTAFDHIAGRQVGDGYGISLGFARAF